MGMLQGAMGCNGGIPLLLLVVLLAVKLAIPKVAAVRESLLTRSTLQALLMPGGIVDTHQEPVRDGSLAALADRLVLAVRPWEAAGRRRKRLIASNNNNP